MDIGQEKSFGSGFSGKDMRSRDGGMIGQQANRDRVEFFLFADVDWDGGSVDESVGVLVVIIVDFQRGGRRKGGELTLGGCRCGW